MARVRTVQTTFHKGELSSDLIGRQDVDIFSQGCLKFRNYRILSQGAATRRPGTEYLVDIGNSGANDTRIIPFEFGDGENYVFCLSTGRLEIFDPSSDTVVQTITSSIPWTSEIREITFTQQGDYIIFFHPDWVPQVITRTGATTFSRSDFEFDTRSGEIQQPYYKFAAADVTMTLNNHTVGTGRILTCSASYFTAAMATNNTRFRIGTGQVKVTGYTSATQVTVQVEKVVTIPLPADPIFILSGTDDVEVTWPDHPLVASDTFDIRGGIAFGGLSDEWTTATLTVDSVKDADTIVCDTTAGSPYANGARGGGTECVVTTAGYATVIWSEEAFSDIRGWPSCGVFYQERLWLAGSTELPDFLAGSQVGLFFDFDVGDGLDDESIQVLVGTGQINRIRHLNAGRNLEIFTTGGELYVRQQISEPITPSNIAVSKQTSYGSGNPAPWQFDGSTLFTQKSGKAVRDYVYSDTELAYTAAAVSILSPQVLQTPLESAVIYGSTEWPESYFLLINNDGTIANYTSEKQEQVSGWAVWEMLGDRTFTSICVIDQDIYAVVLQGSTYRLVRFDFTSTIDLYDKTTYGSTQTVTQLTGKTRFANETDVPLVKVNTDGTQEFVGLVDFDGSGDTTSVLAVPVVNGTYLLVGYDYSTKITPMPVSITLNQGPHRGLPQRIVRVILEADYNFSYTVSGNVITIQRNRLPYDAPANYVKRRTVIHLLGYQRDPTIDILQNEPLPLKLYSITQEVSV